MLSQVLLLLPCNTRPGLILQAEVVDWSDLDIPLHWDAPTVLLSCCPCNDSNQWHAISHVACSPAVLLSRTTMAQWCWNKILFGLSFLSRLWLGPWHTAGLHDWLVEGTFMRSQSGFCKPIHILVWGLRVLCCSQAMSMSHPNCSFGSRLMGSRVQLKQLTGLHRLPYLPLGMYPQIFSEHWSIFWSCQDTKL